MLLLLSAFLIKNESNRDEATLTEAYRHLALTRDCALISSISHVVSTSSCQYPEIFFFFCCPSVSIPPSSSSVHFHFFLFVFFSFCVFYYVYYICPFFLVLFQLLFLPFILFLPLICHFLSVFFFLYCLLICFYFPSWPLVCFCSLLNVLFFFISFVSSSV